MGQLGYEKLDDIIGRTDLLRPRDISLVKTQHLDLSYILSVRSFLYNTLINCSQNVSHFPCLYYLQYDISSPIDNRMLGYQNGVVLKSGIRMFILMVLF